MTHLHRAIAPLVLSALLGGGAAAPVQAAAITMPVQCELGAETVLPWDDVAYDLRGTCGVVRVTADNSTVTMPSATRLVLDGAGNAVTAKPLAAVVIAGPGNSVTTPTIQDLSVTGASSTVAVTGLVELAVLGSSSSSLSADTVNVLRLRGTDTVTARLAYRTRVTGSGNALRLTRADRLVLTGDRNAVTVARGRTTLRDRGEANVLDLRRRRR
ncbi:MAG TPA: hypothetical protein VLK03_02410 [Nocardioides sp.]|nr:hypothetical protein [Nocardioides sp.]